MAPELIFGPPGGLWKRFLEPLGAKLAHEASGGLWDRFWEHMFIVFHSYLMLVACVSAIFNEVKRDREA